MFYFIGIDIAKFKHTACVLDHNGESCVDPFDFSNDSIGFNSLWKAIKPYARKEHRVGMEDTGHYADNLRMFLLDKGCTVCMINPLTSTHLRKAEGLAKNDRLDSTVIAGTLMNPRLFRSVTKNDFDYSAMRQYTRLHHKRMEELCSYKAQLQKDIDHVFPEYNRIFPTVYSKAYMAILKEFQSAAVISRTDIRRLRSVLNPEGRGKHVSLSAEDLKAAAKNSVGRPDAAIEMDIVQLISLIELIEKNLTEVDKKIEEFSRSLNSPILAISGISDFSAMSIISELGDISRFRNEKCVIKFAGVNPTVYESGTYSMTHTHVSKRKVQNIFEGRSIRSSTL